MGFMVSVIVVVVVVVRVMVAGAVWRGAKAKAESSQVK